jgi:chitinase
MLELREASRRITRLFCLPSAHNAALVAVAALAGSVSCGRTPAPYALSGAVIPAPSPSSGGSSGGASSRTGKWVSAYYVGYHQSFYPPSAIAWDGLTHLLIARVVQNADGSLNTTFDVDPVKGPAMARTLVQLAHQHGKKALVMLGGAGTHEAWRGAACSSNRAAFVRNLAALVVEYGFDGFDLDWEPIDTDDHQDLKALAQALRAAVPGTILTLPVGWVGSNNANVGSYYGDIAPLFDQINIMSYGMAGPWPGWQSWHSSALHGESPTTPTSVDVVVNAYLAAGVPAARLGIGIATYGVCWSAPSAGPKTSVGDARIVADDNVMTYDLIQSAYDDPGCEHWDASAASSYLTFSAPRGPQGCTFISYETPRSILEKGEYVKERGLGGTMVWTVSQGYRPSLPLEQRNPLMDALAQAFLR